MIINIIYVHGECCISKMNKNYCLSIKKMKTLSTQVGDTCFEVPKGGWGATVRRGAKIRGHTVCEIVGGGSS